MPYHANGMTNRARAFLAAQKPKQVTEAQVNAALDQIEDIWLVPLDNMPCYQGLGQLDERAVVRRMLEAAANV